MSAARSQMPVPEPSLTVVCPVYDEAENIAKTIEELGRSVGVPFELVVVYDKDDDTTLPVVKRLEPDLPFRVRLVKNAFGRGAANAIRTGFDAAAADAVLVVMADLSDDLVAVEPMYRMLVDGGCDVVCGSRYMPGGQQIGGPRFKGLLSRTAGTSLYWVLGVPTHDATNSFKMYRRSFLREVRVESEGGFEIGIELIAKAWVRRKRIGEVPSVWRDRVAGESRFRLWKWLPKYLRWYLHAFRRVSLRRG